jgi:hypothetical protein
MNRHIRTTVAVVLLCSIAGCFPSCTSTPLATAAANGREAVQACEDAYRTVYDDHRQGNTGAEALDKAKVLYRAAMGEAIAMGMALVRARTQDDDNLNDAPLAQAIAQHTVNLQVAAAKILALKGGK